ncbi:hypothetical protein A2U01_0111015, partial [Trifolium medium]|nr:hypothetical protein [Trifolium medium]
LNSSSSLPRVLLFLVALALLALGFYVMFLLAK